MELKKILKGLSNRTLQEAGILAEEKVVLGQQRMKVCKACPSLRQSSVTCEECGCYMKNKVLVKDAKCPLDKW